MIDKKYIFLTGTTFDVHRHSQYVNYPSTYYGTMKFLSLLILPTTAFQSPKAPLLFTPHTKLYATTEANVKYPTVRGSEVDSRKIVSDQPLLALRVGHVLFAGEEMARQVCFSFFSLFLEFVLCVLVFVVLISLPRVIYSLVGSL